MSKEVIRLTTMPQTYTEFNDFVCIKARERLKNIPIYSENLRSLWPVKNLKQVYDAINIIVLDSQYWDDVEKKMFQELEEQ